MKKTSLDTVTGQAFSPAVLCIEMCGKQEWTLILIIINFVRLSNE